MSDTNDSDHTDLSDDAVPQFVRLRAVDFDTHRSPLRDSHSSRSSTTDNIFLQEPVLTLNVDKSPNQASSIKINKTLEIDPIFSSPPTAASFTAAALNGRFNQIVSLNGCSGVAAFSYDSILPTGASNAVATCAVLNMPDANDNSSCDSGVVFASSLESAVVVTAAQSPLVTQLTSPGRRRKPATPHRIVCPSPIKCTSRLISPGNTATARSPSARKAALSKDQLSPRKSQRNMSAVASKTRRRLNHRDQAPYISAAAMECTAGLSNGTASSSGDDETMTNGYKEVSTPNWVLFKLICFEVQSAPN